jgi:hypothetical protein
MSDHEQMLTDTAKASDVWTALRAGRPLTPTYRAVRLMPGAAGALRVVEEKRD